MKLKLFILKTALAPVLFILPVFTVQAGQGMNEEQMQQMMEQAQKMQECMSGIDQSAMETHAARAEKTSKEMKALCTAGKRDEAQAIAIDYARELRSSEDMQTMKKCSELASGMMQHMHMMYEMDKDYEKNHVCDAM